MEQIQTNANSSENLKLSFGCRHKQVYRRDLERHHSIFRRKKKATLIRLPKFDLSQSRLVRRGLPTWLKFMLSAWKFSKSVSTRHTQISFSLALLFHVWLLQDKSKELFVCLDKRWIHTAKNLSNRWFGKARIDEVVDTWSIRVCCWNDKF